MKTTTEAKTYSPKQAAEILNVSQQSLRRYYNEGKLRAVKTPGNHHRYLAEDVDSMLASFNKVGSQNPSEETNIWRLSPEKRKEVEKQQEKERILDIYHGLGVNIIENSLQEGVVLGSKSVLYWEAKLDNNYPFGFLKYLPDGDTFLYYHQKIKLSKHDLKLSKIVDILFTKKEFVVKNKKDIDNIISNIYQKMLYRKTKRSKLAFLLASIPLLIWLLSFIVLAVNNPDTTNWTGITSQLVFIFFVTGIPASVFVLMKLYFLKIYSLDYFKETQQYLNQKSSK